MNNIKLTFNGAGTERIFTDMLDLAIANMRPNNYIFRYLEIGSATGGTLVQVASHLKKKCSAWKATGIDLEGCRYFNPVEYLRSASGLMADFVFAGNHQMPHIEQPLNSVRILLLRSPDRRFGFDPQILNFVLIDGCHGAPCVEADFLNIEQSVVEGGIIAFHDAGFQDQGISPQPHCNNQPIGVLEALKTLNLLTPANNPVVGEVRCIRSGWKLLAHVEGDKSVGNAEQNGHGFAFFQRVPKPPAQTVSLGFIRSEEKVNAI